MKLLALDTSTEACSAALFIDGEISERFEITPKAHTKLLLPMIESLLAEAELKLSQLDALAFGCGPGSFTGLRIATGVVQGLAFGADLPVVPVSTLAALAQNCSQNLAFVAIDARVGEIFWGVYQKNVDGFVELVGKEAVLPVSQIQFPNQPAIGMGSGWHVYETELLAKTSGLISQIESDALPHSSAIAKLGVYGFEQGRAVAAEFAQPVYLRDKVAQTEQERVAAKMDKLAALMDNAL
ncbi:MAG: tRNA (adenosine(37)-N6)-threonylcarbamoyltransferase complex dimerization subunit type 1 TsaB [Methylococcaceae bacterium]